MRRVLVVGPSWVGDMVMAQSLFGVLLQADPDIAISVLAPQWSEPILARMPEVARTEVMPIGHGKLALGVRRRLGHRLREQGFERAIVLPGSLKSALVPWFARIPVRTGFLGEQRYGLLNDIRKLDRQALPLNVQRYVALGLPPGSPTPADYPSPSLRIDPGERSVAREKFELPPDGPVLALCPGAEYGPAKRWPVEHFAAVAAERLDRGWQVWLFGSERDRAVTEEIDRQTGGRCANLAGRTSLGEAVDLLSLAGHAVTNDSGLMHVAAAVGCRVIALFGSSSDAYTPPLADDAVRLALDLDCRPCFKRECPLGHLDCLVKLTPERVLAHLPGD